jgi:outer membrane protein OmpA-like peptidoglycan-associated protein
VGFNYNSAELLTRHSVQLRDVAESISPDADVTITGYTDRVGDAERNRLLSLERARGVEVALKGIKERLGETMPRPRVLGLGNEHEVFENDLPEGRMLSRMVKVTINREMAR